VAITKLSASYHKRTGCIDGLAVQYASSGTVILGDFKTGSSHTLQSVVVPRGQLFTQARSRQMSR
jgi:hypothetical protein